MKVEINRSTHSIMFSGFSDPSIIFSTKGGEKMMRIEAVSIEEAKEKASAFVVSAIDIFAKENPTEGVYSMYVVNVEVECQGSA